MFYYKKQVNGDYCYYSSPFLPKSLDDVIEITQEEYDVYIAQLDAEAKANAPTEEEIRAEKEAQLRALMNELYPVEE